MRPMYKVPGPALRGKFMILTVILLPVILGACALTVDLGLQAAAQGQLRTAADAAALAGARALALEYINNTSEDTATRLGVAVTEAQRISAQGQNRVFGTPVTHLLGSGPGGTGEDLLVGYIDITSTSSALDTSSGMSDRYNSVRATAARLAARGTALSPAFSWIWGIQGIDVRSTSTATAQLYTIKGFTPGSQSPVDVLPIVMPKANYDAMTAGNTPDQYAYNPTSKTVSPGTDGVGESQLYPVQSGSPGNWGTVKLGVTNNSTSVLGDQIRYGLTAEQIATFPDSTIQLDTSQNPPSLTLGGNPGLSAGIKDDIEAIIGTVRPIMVYDTNGGNGNNAWFRVVAFGFVRIMAEDFKGADKYVLVQPAAGFDGSGIPGEPLPGSWQTTTGLVRLSLTR